jgi:hypothetical protein
LKEKLRQSQSLFIAGIYPSVQQSIKNYQYGLQFEISWLQYMQTLSSDALHKWASQKVSIIPSDKLVGHPAVPITADYWFNVPSGKPIPKIPAPGQVSLIMFVSSSTGMINVPNNGRQFQELRRVHKLFPQLQIVTVAITSGVFHAKNVIGRPDSEANLLHQYLTDSLQLPGILCVVKNGYRTLPNGHVLPDTNSVLNAYHLDPRAGRYQGREFLVDATGTIVRTLGISSLRDEELIRRLLAQARDTSRAAAAQTASDQK